MIVFQSSTNLKILNNKCLIWRVILACKNVKFFVKNLFHNCLTIRGINTYLCLPFEIKEGKRLLTLLVGKKKNTLEFQIQDKNYS